MDAALGMAAASFFVLKSKKDTAESPTTLGRLSESCGNALKNYRIGIRNFKINDAGARVSKSSSD